MFAGEMADDDLGRAIPWKRQRVFRQVVLARQIAERWQQRLRGRFADGDGLDDGKVMEGAFRLRHVDIADGAVGGAEVDADEKTACSDGFSGFHRRDDIIIKVKIFMDQPIAQKPLKARSGQRLSGLLAMV